jgi:hypothetical protein
MRQGDLGRRKLEERVEIREERSISEEGLTM